MPNWLEGIVALPDQLFYNTGINTYIWIVTNRNQRKRRGKVQLVNAVDLFVKMRKSLGNKRNLISDEHIEQIVALYGDFEDSGNSKIFVSVFGRVTLESLLLFEHFRLGRFQDAIEPAKHRHRQHDFAVFGRTVGAAEEVRDVPDEADQVIAVVGQWLFLLCLCPSRCLKWDYVCRQYEVTRLGVW
jgi:type I restriction-modification system DNA methylase subunit